jgi:hypothetical protein
MEEKNGFKIKEVLADHIKHDEEFEKQIWLKLNDLNDKITNEVKKVIELLNKYMLANDNRIGVLEGKQKVTAKTIAIYVALIGTFAMLVINFYMSFK